MDTEENKEKEVIIGISTVALALVLSITSSILAMRQISLEQETASSLPVVATAESVLSFPMMAQYLTKPKIINSEFGRLALSCSIVSNIFSFCVITLTVLTNKQSGERFAMLKTLSSGIAMELIIFVVVQPIILWTLKCKPKGESLTDEYIYVTMVGVLAAAFASQAGDLNIYVGPLLYRLAMPAGPPLGSAQVEKLELIASWLFMPLFFVKNGLVTDIFSADFKTYLVVKFIITVAWIGKFLGALISSFYCNIPYKDAVLLGLVMNAQGVLELGMYKMMKQAKVCLPLQVLSSLFLLPRKERKNKALYFNLYFNFVYCGNLVPQWLVGNRHEAFVVMCTSMLIVIDSYDTHA